MSLSKVDRAYHYLTRAFAFVVVLLMILAGVNSFLQPIWFYENNYHTYHSFYQEPVNTIETVFVGASMTLHGFSPMEMYDQDGICAYNLASASQPLMMSYYWVKEAQRLHPETLDTVVCDVSMLRRGSTDEDYRRALDGMAKDSPVKNEAIDDLTTTPLDVITYRLPVFGYHDRWASIDYTDFVKYNDEDLEDYARGYFMEFYRIFDESPLQEYHPIEEIPVPLQVLDETAAPATFEKESLYYLNKLIEFCDKNDIKLVLCKTPSPSNWSSGEHNGIQQIADSYGLAFLDFEIEPLISEINYCPPLDTRDLRKHLNYYGAMKISKWMSTYLANECGNQDVRGIQRYTFLESQLARYRTKVTQMGDATESVDPIDYITKVAQADNYTILISVRGEAASALTAPQRLAAAKLGLNKLASLRYQDSYLAVITDGKVETELQQHNSSSFDADVDRMVDRLQLELEAQEQQGDAEEVEPVEEDEPIDLGEIEAGEWEEDEEESTTTALVHSGQLADGTIFTLTSGGAKMGNTSSCVIGDEESSKECSPKKRGLNIVVYDNDSHRVVDVASFDTHSSSTRDRRDVDVELKEVRKAGTRYSQMSKTLKRLHRYKRRMKYAVEARELKASIGSTGLYHYLQNFSRNNLIILIAVKGDATGNLTEEVRAAFAQMGLTDLADIYPNESYCAAIEDGVVVEEQRGFGEEPITLERKWYTLTSGGAASGNVASIVIDDNGYSADYSTNSRGFNIVVYNALLDIVVDRAHFDTTVNAVDLSGVDVSAQEAVEMNENGAL